MSLEQASKDFAAALLALATAVAASIVPAGAQAVAETPAATKPKKEPKAAKGEKPAEVAGPTAKQVADAILLLAETNRDTAVAILGQFNVKRVGELKPADYAAAFKLASDANAAPAVVVNDSLV
jgi:hypothetical protein